MGWSLFAKILGKEVDNAGNAAASALVNLDPETGLEVDHDTLVDRLQKLAARLAKARAQYQKEANDVVELDKQINQKIAAAEILQNQGNTVSLERLMAEIEGDQQRLELEKQEKTEVEAACQELEDLVKQAQVDLDTFKQNASRVKRELELSAARKENAEELAKQKQELEALRTGIGKNVNSAMTAINKKIADNNAAAEAAKTVAAASTPTSQKDDAIQKAMAEAAHAGQPTAVADRLAALKAKRSAS